MSELARPWGGKIPWTSIDSNRELYFDLACWPADVPFRDPGQLNPDLFLKVYRHFRKREQDVGVSVVFEFHHTRSQGRAKIPTESEFIPKDFRNKELTFLGPDDDSLSGDERDEHDDDEAADAMHEDKGASSDQVQSDGNCLILLNE